MKRVFIIHGWGGNPKEPMLNWLKRELEKRDYKVINPKMPHANKPEIKEWIDHLKKVVKIPDKDAYFIGHSVWMPGCSALSANHKQKSRRMYFNCSMDAFR